MKAFAAILSMMLLLLSQDAIAWNGRGHMIVAAVAWNHMTPQARARAVALLKLNSMYKSWVKSVPARNRGQIAFVIAATWPDVIKHTTGFSNDGEKPANPGAAQNIGYKDKLMHKYWHYIDKPFSPDNTTLVNPVPPNAETQIETFRDTIGSSSATNNVKSYDLVWLLHLVGDVHQPLHATSRFTHDQPDGDQGGNLVCLSDGCKSELHAYWDDLLGVQKVRKKGDKTTNIDAVNAKAAITAAKKLSEADATEAANADDTAWVEESFEDAKTYAYASPIGNDAGPFVLSETYNTKAKEIADTRAELAGERLANLLDGNLR